MEERLQKIESVKIDGGTFKYILVKVYDPDNEDTIFKYIVRGIASSEYHADIYEVICPDIEAIGFECECVGGGRIKHDMAEKNNPCLWIFPGVWQGGPSSNMSTSKGTLS